LLLRPILVTVVAASADATVCSGIIRRVVATDLCRSHFGK